MSTCYHLECDKHKKSIWIGQRSHDRYYIYSGQEKTMDALSRFLYAHEGCALFFRGDNESLYMDGTAEWEQIEDGDGE